MDSTKKIATAALIVATLALYNEYNDEEEDDSTGNRTSGVARVYRRNVKLKESIMKHMLDTGDDRMYRFLFRMRKKYFDKLLRVYAPIFFSKHLKEDRNVHRVRTRQIPARLSLALTLRYLCSSSEAVDSAWDYGLLPSNYSVYMRHGIRCLNDALDTFKDTSYDVPAWKNLRQFADVITEKENGEIKNVWGAVDGTKLRFERSSDFIVEGNAYNGHKQMHCIKLLCVFAPDGSICGAAWGPGVTRDSTLFNKSTLHGILELQQRDRPQGTERLYILGDSAFRNEGVVLQATSSYIKDPRRLKIFRRVRNYSEIGIGSLNRCFRRLNNKLPADDEEHINLIIEATLKMNNFRVRIARCGQLLRMHREFMYTDSDFEDTEESDEEIDGMDQDDDEEMEKEGDDSDNNGE